MFFNKKGLLLFFVLAPAILFAQQLRFSHITEEQGLSQRIVNCILQDSKGYMWIGTQDGLNRYDGYEIKVFKNDPNDTNSISNNYIESLFEDEDGNLWIGSKGNIDIYNLKSGAIQHYDSETLQANVIKTIFCDSEKKMWIGTDNGIRLLDIKSAKVESFTFEIPAESIPQSKNVWSITEDASGVLWLASYGNYIYSFDKKSAVFSNFKLEWPTALPACKSVRTLFLLENKNILIGTEGGMFEFSTKDTSSLKYYSENSHDNTFKLSSNRVSSIVETEDYIWIGTIYGGLNSLNKNTLQITQHQSRSDDVFSISDNSIKCMYIDNTGSLWIGTENGVDVVFKSANKFQHFKNFVGNGAPVNVYSLLVDDDETLWIGTNGNGLASFDKKDNLFYTHEGISTGKNKSVLSLLEDSEGLWIGTWGDGLKYFDQKRDLIISYDFSSYKGSNGDILSIVSENANKIWLGTYGGGIFSINKSKNEVIQLSTSDGLSGNHIYCLFLNDDGKLWVGTDAAGLNIIDLASGKVEVIQRSKGNNLISSNTINCIIKDSKGTIWLGTSSGLNKYNASNKTFEKFYEKDGLPNDYIYGIMEDKKGNLWISTNNGISRFNPNIDNINGSAFRNYGVSDGLQGKEFNQGAFCMSKNGEMFFGGTNGFNSFYPDKIEVNNHQPNVYITGIKLFGKNITSDTNIADKKYIELSWKENFISFEFVALDYLMPLQNKYSYKLEGVDDEWSLPGSIRIAAYTQLEPGDYTFKVKAANSDGIWNEEGASIRIHIVPPFWKTKWFYALCIITFITGIFGFIRWRTSSIKKEKKILESKVEERTKELAEKNRDITSSIQYAKRIQEAILPNVNTITGHFPKSFILYKPKDIVSGDFYWFAEKKGKKIIAAVDCTGHGVPGAFMSMIGHNLLNQIVVENEITDPAGILDELHKGVQTALKQGKSGVIDTSDGMDVAICVFDEKTTTVTYAGAMRPLFLLSGESLERISGNKFPIGGAQLDLERRFTNHTRLLKKGDRVYLFSDGYADQFGGEKGKKFMLKRFSEMLISMKTTDINQQSNLLDETVEKWREGYEQVDDILVIGIEV